MSETKTSAAAVEAFFDAIRRNDSETVRQLVTTDRSLTSCTTRHPPLPQGPSLAAGYLVYPAAVERDAYRFLGAYWGAVTGLHYALLLGHSDLARDIIDSSYDCDLSLTYGQGNTALHLATLLGERSIVQLLLSRGVSDTVKNGKGMTPLDVVDDVKLRELFEHAGTGRPLGETASLEFNASQEALGIAV